MRNSLLFDSNKLLCYYKKDIKEREVIIMFKYDNLLNGGDGIIEFNAKNITNNFSYNNIFDGNNGIFASNYKNITNKFNYLFINY